MVDGDPHPLDASLLAPAPSDTIVAGVKILAGRYELLGLLGEGGMGSVYSVRDHELGEVVALKVLRRDLVAAPEMLERFRQEVRLARKVTSPNVARTFDIGEHDGERFLTMELVDGESLAALLAREGALPQARAIVIASSVLCGLASAHVAGVIHRDLKPGNVLLGRDGSVKVTDFGIAKAQESDPCATRGLVGSPSYMAPEQVTGDGNIDPRADIYAFGAMFFETLTGVKPWNGTSSLAIAAARLLAPPPDPRAIRNDISPTIASLIMRCMARARDDRPRSAAEVTEALAMMTSSGSEPHPHHSPPALGTSVAKAIAVLPFGNNGAAGDDYLADGLTDDLIDGLSMSPGLRVQSRRAVTGYKGTLRDARDIGRELGVQAFVEGSVRRAGTRLRLSVRLVSVRDGFQIWAKRFDCPEGEMLEAADEATAAIAAALTVDPLATRRTPPADPIALDLYLRARHAFHSFQMDGAGGARSLFEQALSRAPDDAMILSGYAMTLLRTLGLGGSFEQFDAGLRAAERAAELGPHLAEAQLVLATLRLHLGRHADAARHALRALEIAPSSADARAFVGRLLVESGRTAEGLAHLAIAQDLDPRLTLARLDRVRTYALLADWDRARDLLAGGYADDSPFVYWAHAARLFGQWRRDPEDLASIRERFGKSALRDDAPLREALEGNDPTAFRRIIELNLGGGSTKGIDAFRSQLLAEVHAACGRDAEAFQELLTADENCLMDVLWIDHCPLLGKLRAEPRFPAVRARVQARADEIIAVLATPSRSR